MEHPLRLEPVAGPQTPPIEIPPRSTVTIGRSLQCDYTLSNEAVSRRHATLIQRAGHWLISDLGSRHGTNLNGQPVPVDQPAMMSDDDLVGIGPYAFRVNLGGRRRHMATTFEDRSAGQTRIERVGEFERGRLAQHRLDLLVQCASTIHGAADEETLADAVLDSLLAGSGFHHAVPGVLFLPKRCLQVKGHRVVDGVGDTCLGEGTHNFIALGNQHRELMVNMTCPGDFGG